MWKNCYREAEELQLAKEMSVAHNIVGWIDRPLSAPWVGGQLWSALCYDWLASDWGGTYDEAVKPICWTASSPQGGGSGRDWAGLSLDTAPKDVQERVFHAKSNSLKNWPTVVHTRDALRYHEIIKSEGVGPRGGIMHSYSGNKPFEMQSAFYRARNDDFLFWVVTLRKRRIFRRRAEPSLDKILVETDAILSGAGSKRGRENKQPIHAML